MRGVAVRSPEHVGASGRRGRRTTRHDRGIRRRIRHLLIRKRLLTGAQRSVIAQGTRSRGVVTGMNATGAGHEVQLDLMVTRPDGGQFPARETAVIPAATLPKMAPGSIVDAYYRPGDHSIIAVRVHAG